jgi:hypothetical protein
LDSGADPAKNGVTCGSGMVCTYGTCG